MSNEENKQVAIPERLNNFFGSLIDSKKLPVHIKSVQDAYTIAQMGKELGFPVMQAFHYIIPIQGRLTLSAKAINAILHRGGIRVKTVEDGVYVYRDGSVNEVKMEGAIDRRTTIVMTRDGVEEKVSFSWKDAVAAGLSEKDNWKRMPREMLWARCLSKGANRIAADMLLGLYSTDELHDALDKNNEIKVMRDDDGTISSIVTEEAEIVS